MSVERVPQPRREAEMAALERGLAQVRLVLSFSTSMAAAAAARRLDELNLPLAYLRAHDESSTVVRVSVVARRWQLAQVRQTARAFGGTATG